MSPVAGTTRYLCPLECGWYHDRPPHPTTWVPTAVESIQEMAAEITRQDAARVEKAVREHLATHTMEQFARVIHDLRAEIAALKSSKEPTR